MFLRRSSRIGRGVKGRFPLNVELPDGSVIEVPDGAATADVAAAVSPQLAREAIAGRLSLDGTCETYDLNQPLPGERFDELVGDLAYADVVERNELDPDLIDEVFAVAET